MLLGNAGALLQLFNGGDAVPLEHGFQGDAGDDLGHRGPPVDDRYFCLLVYYSVYFSRSKVYTINIAETPPRAGCETMTKEVRMGETTVG
jgi:hypothetical protein